MDGFQQAHTVTRVIRRNMPPVDRMMYSELRPKPDTVRLTRNTKRKKKNRFVSNKQAIAVFLLLIYQLALSSSCSIKA